jgi:hypothetical protein
MLETIREYAMERLQADGEEAEARRAHAAWFRALAEDAESGLRGPRQQHWRDVLEADLDNFRAALGWTLGADDPQNAECGVSLVGALWYFWFQRGLTREARRWLELALARAPQEGPAPRRCWARARWPGGRATWRPPASPWRRAPRSGATTTTGPAWPRRCTSSATSASTSATTWPRGSARPCSAGR